MLTYNLLPAGETRRAVVDADCELIGELAGCLEEHFGGPEAPRRLVYLLDHHYTQRAVSWSRLKGGDAGDYDRREVTESQITGHGCAAGDYVRRRFGCPTCWRQGAPTKQGSVGQGRWCCSADRH